MPARKRMELVPVTHKALAEEVEAVAASEDALRQALERTDDAASATWMRSTAPNTDQEEQEHGKSMANQGYREPVDELDDDPRDMHRAIVSMMEEPEAVDWHKQRVNACKRTELDSILQHNADEEKEDAGMVLEWPRRRDPVFDKERREWLFTDKQLDH